MIQVTAKYGATRSVQSSVESGTTVEELADSNIGEVLQLPESYTATINGSVVDGNTVLRDGDTVSFEKRAASKAA
jgi:molybdopterin converting factor small subunit